MKRMLMAVAVLFCLGVPPGAFAAVDGLLVGAAITNGSDSDLGLGARVEYSLEALLPNLGIAGGLNFFFPRDPYDSWWEVNAAALYHFYVNETFTPYAGAGFALASWEEQLPVDADSGAPPASAHDSSFALNLLGGCKFDFGIGFTPFVEARVGVGGGNGLEITAGGLFEF